MPHSRNALLYFFGLGLARLIYRVTVTGRETSAARAVFCCCRITSPGSTRSFCSSRARDRSASSFDEEYYRNRISASVSAPAPAASRSPRRARRMRCAPRRKKFARARSSAFFPKGELSRTGTLLRLRRGYELIARQADAPVVPVWLDRLWGSIFSFKADASFTKWPRRIAVSECTVAFGEPLAAGRSRHRDGARGIAQARRVLLQPAADPATNISRTPACAD